MTTAGVREPGVLLTILLVPTTVLMYSAILMIVTLYTVYLS